MFLPLKISLLWISFLGPVVIGFSETSYTVSESEGTATVTVEILEGTVADDSITVQFSTRDNTALRMFMSLAHLFMLSDLQAKA